MRLGDIQEALRRSLGTPSVQTAKSNNLHHAHDDGVISPALRNASPPKERRVLGTSIQAPSHSYRQQDNRGENSDLRLLVQVR